MSIDIIPFIEVTLPIIAGKIAGKVSDETLNSVVSKVKSTVLEKMRNPEKTFNEALKESIKIFNEENGTNIRTFMFEDIPPGDKEAVKDRIRKILHENFGEKTTEFCEIFFLCWLERLPEKQRESILREITVRSFLRIDELREWSKEFRIPITDFLENFKRTKEAEERGIRYFSLCEIKDSSGLHPVQNPTFPCERARWER